MPPNDPKDPRFTAMLDLIGRTGAEGFQIRYSDDEHPTLWMAVALYQDRFDCAAASDPFAAVERLCDELIDGGTCKHCGKPTGFALDTDAMPLDQLVCWYQWDPSTEKIVKGCAE